MQAIEDEINSIAAEMGCKRSVADYDFFDKIHELWVGHYHVDRQYLISQLAKQKQRIAEIEREKQLYSELKKVATQERQHELNVRIGIIDVDLWKFRREYMLLHLKIPVDMAKFKEERLRKLDRMIELLEQRTVIRLGVEHAEPEVEKIQRVDSSPIRAKCSNKELAPFDPYE